MKKSFISLAAIATFAVGLAGCSGFDVPGGPPGPTPNPTVTNPPTPQGNFIQMERLARPAVKEALETFSMHDTSVRVSPNNDPTLTAAIGTFVTTVAGRAPAYATTLQAVLVPDELAVDLSRSDAGGYLGVETAGAAAGGNKFGGRRLTDDVISADLGVVFGTTLSALGLVPDDGKANTCLSKQNVAINPNQTQGTFPYLATPH